MRPRKATKGNALASPLHSPPARHIAPDHAPQLVHVEPLKLADPLGGRKVARRHLLAQLRRLHIQQRRRPRLRCKDRVKLHFRPLSRLASRYPPPARTWLARVVDTY